MGRPTGTISGVPWMFPFLSQPGGLQDITELGSPKHSQGLGQVKERGQQPRPRTELRMAGTLHMTRWAQAWHVGHPQDIEPLETLQVWFSG